MPTPLISTVIPTYGRPWYLPRAVESALRCQGSNVEVVVVPNGPDRSYKESLAEFASDKRVRIHPIDIAHGCVARNHGLELARGKYVRFLDDDDYVCEAAADQIRYIEESSAEVCSGLLSNVDQSGDSLGTVGFPNTRDFVCAALTVSGFTLPTGNVFLRSSLKDCLWDPKLNRAQDYAWMLDLATKREWSWTHFPQLVGVWYQHDAPRVSSTRALRGKEPEIIGKLLNIHQRLTNESRLNSDRARYIAMGLWYYIHRGFPYHPIYWSHIARRSQRICADVRPVPSIFQKGIFGIIDPLYSEWLMLPARRISQMTRNILNYAHGPEHRRRL